MKIIDTHVHVFERMTGYGFVGGLRPIGNGVVAADVGQALPFWPAEFGDKGVLAENFLEFMDKNGIAKACIMQGPVYGIHNHYIREVMDKYPDRFLGAAFVDPEIAFFTPVLNNLIQGMKFRLFKLEMSTVGGIMGCHASDTWKNPNMDVLFKAVNDVHGTISLDIGGPAEPSYQIDRVLELASNNPDLNVVFCHLMEPEGEEFEDYCKNMEKVKLDNVYTEVSAITKILKDSAPFELSRKYVNKAIEILGVDHVMWGSDAPGTLMVHDYKTMFDKLVLENDFLTEDQKEMVAYKNAEKAYPFE